MSKKYKYRERWMHEGVRVDVKANSKAELRDKIAKKKQALEEGRILVESNMLLKDWVNIAYSQYKTGVSDITLKREKQKCQKWLVEPLGHMPLKKIKPLHLQGVLNELQGYSSTFVKEVHRIYKWVFNLAVQNDLIVKSPAGDTVISIGRRFRRSAPDRGDRYRRSSPSRRRDKCSFLRSPCGTADRSRTGS